MSAGKLYVVATPIGNLEDITLRAVRTLKEVDVVFAEDTRVTRKLLSHLGIQKPTERFDENISPERINRLAEVVLNGKNVALVTDAGTPNISDPGSRLISLAVKSDIKVIPIPGPSALTTALSVAHFPVNDFIFLGFPPTKKRRNKFFDSVAQEKKSVALYESTHRILRTIGELAERMPEREVLVAKELTKLYERIWRGRIGEIAVEFGRLTKEELKGEWVVIIAKISA